MRDLFYFNTYLELDDPRTSEIGLGDIIFKKMKWFVPEKEDIYSLLSESSLIWIRQSLTEINY